MDITATVAEIATFPATYVTPIGAVVITVVLAIAGFRLVKKMTRSVS